MIISFGELLKTLIEYAVVPIFKTWVEKISQERTPNTSIARKDALVSTWEGEYNQKTGRETLITKHPVELRISRMAGYLYGNVILRISNSNEVYGARLKNFIYDGTNFKADYVNKDSNITQFGSILGKLSADGQSIEGQFSGYGLLSEMFVRGEIQLKRKITA